MTITGFFLKICLKSGRYRAILLNKKYLCNKRLIQQLKPLLSLLDGYEYPEDARPPLEMMDISGMERELRRPMLLVRARVKKETLSNISLLFYVHCLKWS